MKNQNESTNTLVQYNPFSLVRGMNCKSARRVNNLLARLGRAMEAADARAGVSDGCARE